MCGCIEILEITFTDIAVSKTVCRSVSPSFSQAHIIPSRVEKIIKLLYIPFFGPKHIGLLPSNEWRCTNVWTWLFPMQLVVPPSFY